VRTAQKYAVNRRLYEIGPLRSSVATVLVVLFLVLASVAGHAQQNLLPLSKGNFWVYSANVRWTVANSNRVRRTKPRWKMEVTDVYREGRAVVAILTGGPWDLTWYEPGVKPGKYAIVRESGTYYLLNNPDEAALRDTLKKQARTPAEWDAWFRLPLTESGRFCTADQEPRKDRMYCWVVDNISQVDLAGIAGVRPRSATQYALAFRTLPDHEIVKFVPEVGIVSWSYAHHGTVAEANVKLVEYRSGKRDRR
jgi:hypothetical protein